MPEVTPDATLIIATSWQALSRAETGDERASICNCTVIIVFAAFFTVAAFAFTRWFWRFGLRRYTGASA